MTQAPAAPNSVPGSAQSAAAANYLRAKVLTATPEQLQLMLYDGAIRFAEQGKAALAERRLDKSYEALTRAQNILHELTGGLRHDVSPEVCKNLAALYDFAFRRLLHANLHQDAAAVDEALTVLRYQRETWLLLMSEVAKTRAAGAARELSLPTADAERVERLSVAG